MGKVFTGRGVLGKNMASSTESPPRERHGFVWVCLPVCLSGVPELYELEQSPTGANRLMCLTLSVTVLQKQDGNSTSSVDSQQLSFSIKTFQRIF